MKIMIATLPFGAFEVNRQSNKVFYSVMMIPTIKERILCRVQQTIWELPQYFNAQVKLIEDYI